LRYRAIALAITILILTSIIETVPNLSGLREDGGSGGNSGESTLEVNYYYTYDALGLPNANNPWGDATPPSPPQTYYINDTLIANITAHYSGNFTNFLLIRYLYKGTELVWQKLIRMDGNDVVEYFNFTAGSWMFGYGNYVMNITHFIGYISTPDGTILNPPNISSPFSWPPKSSGSVGSRVINFTGVVLNNIGTPICSCCSQNPGLTYMPQDPNKANETYTLCVGAASMEEGAGGTVEPSGCFTYNEPVSITITAYPNEDSVLDHWTINGNFAGGGNSITIYVNDNMTVIAFFKLKRKKLTISVEPLGGGDTDPAPGTYKYKIHSIVSVTAHSNSDKGYYLDHWRLDGGVVPPDNPITIKMDDDHTLSAEFVRVWFDKNTELYNFTVVPYENTSVWLYIYPYYAFMHWTTESSMYFPHWDFESNVSALILLIGVNGTEGRLAVENVTIKFYALRLEAKNNTKSINSGNFTRAFEVTMMDITDYAEPTMMVVLNNLDKNFSVLYPSIYYWNSTDESAVLANDTILNDTAGIDIINYTSAFVDYRDFPGRGIYVMINKAKHVLMPREPEPGEVAYIPIWYNTTAAWDEVAHLNASVIAVNVTIQYASLGGTLANASTLSNITDSRYFATFYLFRSEWNESGGSYIITPIRADSPQQLWIEMNASSKHPLNFTQITYTINITDENLTKYVGTGGTYNTSSATESIGQFLVDLHYAMSGNNTVVRYFVSRDMPFMMMFRDLTYWPIYWIDEVMEPTGVIIRDIPPRLPILYPFADVNITYTDGGPLRRFSMENFPLRVGNFTIYVNTRPGGLRVNATYLGASDLYELDIYAPEEEGGVLWIRIPELNYTVNLENNTLYGLLGFSGRKTVFIKSKYLEEITIEWQNSFGYFAQRTVKVEYVSRWALLTDLLIKISLTLLIAAVVLFLFDKYREKFWRLVRGD